jgi:hypothetical protein
VQDGNKLFQSSVKADHDRIVRGLKAIYGGPCAGLKREF